MTNVDKNGINIVVVDDEEVVLSLVRDALEDDGFNVKTASDAFAAIEIIDAWDADLLISDIRMPRMDGIELVQSVREKHPNIEVIFTTGYANLNTAKEALRQGASDYILKPFELKEIRQAVNKVAEKVKRLAEARESDEQLSRLSDLHRMLFTVGDRKTLAMISLRFAMMHCDSDCGGVVYWNSTRGDVGMLGILNDQVYEEQLSERIWLESLEEVDASALQEPSVVAHLDDHALLGGRRSGALRERISRFWHNGHTDAVVVPVNRGSTIFGLLLVGVDQTSAKLGEMGLKFLSFTAHQLAMSLENLELLEEAQNAYTRLKELQDETIQLEKMATRGEMSAEIGHELNNFLGVVAGNLSILDHQIKNRNHDELERYVSAMADNIEKIKKFTSNLMDLRPISSKKEIIYFDKLIAEVIDYLKPQRRFKNVQIRLTPIEQPLPFEADTIHIQQVLYNLFNNAADAMVGREGRQIEVSTESKPNEGTFRVTISDTGSGIPKELLPKVFNEKFTTKEKGHGFGLIVCKRIIENHRGRLLIESAPDVGTSVTIELPLKQPTREVSAPA